MADKEMSMLESEPEEYHEISGNGVYEEDDNDDITMSLSEVRRLEEQQIEDAQRTNESSVCILTPPPRKDPETVDLSDSSANYSRIYMSSPIILSAKANRDLIRATMNKNKRKRSPVGCSSSSSSDDDEDDNDEFRNMSNRDKMK